VELTHLGETFGGVGSNHRPCVFGGSDHEGTVFVGQDGGVVVAGESDIGEQQTSDECVFVNILEVEFKTEEVFCRTDG
jgi:hypothetical protein